MQRLQNKLISIFLQAFKWKNMFDKLTSWFDCLKKILFKNKMHIDSINCMSVKSNCKNLIETIAYHFNFNSKKEK